MVNVQSTENNSIMRSETKTIACKLTTPELQNRKRTIIAELKNAIREREETEHGVKYAFEGTDKMIDLVTSFIKTERLCCDFFDFRLSVGDAHAWIWLELSGPEGAKQFIQDEIGL